MLYIEHIGIAVKNLEPGLYLFPTQRQVPHLYYKSPQICCLFCLPTSFFECFLFLPLASAAHFRPITLHRTMLVCGRTSLGSTFCAFRWPLCRRQLLLNGVRQHSPRAHRSCWMFMGPASPPLRLRSAARANERPLPRNGARSKDATCNRSRAFSSSIILKSREMRTPRGQAPES